MSSTLWDKYIGLIQEDTSLSQDLKLKVKEAYSFLRLELGEQFLDKSVHGHGLNEKIFNRAPWQLEDLVSMVETLQLLKHSSSNYHHLINKLKSRDKSRAEGIPMIELSKMILDAGLEVKIEPDVRSVKKPDLEIVNLDNGEKIYGELSVLNNSDERNKKASDHFFLFQIVELTPPYVHYSCKQRKTLNRQKDGYLSEFINECKRQVIRRESFQVFENEFIEIAFAVESKLPDLKLWIEEKDLLLDQISGFELDFNESKRIVNNKIGEKAKQIPEDYNGIIFIRVNPLFFMSDGVEALIPLAQRELSKYSNIVGLIVYSFLGYQQQTGMMALDGGFLSLKQVNQLSSRYALFILNKETDLKISDNTLKKIFAICEA